MLYLLSMETRRGILWKLNKRRKMSKMSLFYIRSILAVNFKILLINVSAKMLCNEKRNKNFYVPVSFFFYFRSPFLQFLLIFIQIIIANMTFFYMKFFYQIFIGLHVDHLAHERGLWKVLSLTTKRRLKEHETYILFHIFYTIDERFSDFSNKIWLKNYLLAWITGDWF